MTISETIPPEDTRDQYLDPVGDATGQVITIKKAMPVPLIPLKINAPALEKKALGFFLRMGKTGPDFLFLQNSSKATDGRVVIECLWVHLSKLLQPRHDIVNAFSEPTYH